MTLPADEEVDFDGRRLSDGATRRRENEVMTKAEGLSTSM